MHNLINSEIGYLCKMEDGGGVESDPADGDPHHEDALHQEGRGEEVDVNHPTWTAFPSHYLLIFLLSLTNIESALNQNDEI